MNDKISIIMPAYNSSQFIDYSIDSVLNQSHSNFELIIVDDCSKDNTCEIVEKYCTIDPRVKLIKLEKNGGVSNARNIAIRNSTGSFLSFLDSDDVLNPLKLERQYAFMINNDVFFSYTNYRKIDENGNVIKKCQKLPKKNNSRQVLYKMSMLTSTSMIDLSHIKKEDVFFPLIKSSEDRACYYEVLKKYKCSAKLFDELLTDYRVHSKSLSSNKKENMKLTWKFYREVEGFNFIKSSILFVLYVLYAILKRV